MVLLAEFFNTLLGKMITSTHIIWNLVALDRFAHRRADRAAIVIGSALPDVEILIWMLLLAMKRFFGIDLFDVDYHNLLFGSGISRNYWYMTLTWHSAITVVFGFVASRLCSGPKRRVITLFTAALLLHILVDIPTHREGMFLLWPLYDLRVGGGSDFISLPLPIILTEQAWTFSLLAFYLRRKPKPAGANP